MKKIVAIMLIFGLVSLLSGFAEQSFDSMSDDDLKAAYESITNEMVNRELLTSAVLGNGQYVVGVDLAEGTYNVSSAGIGSYYFIFPTKESYEQYNWLRTVINLVLSPTLLDKDQPIRIELRYGGILYIPQGPVKIEKIQDSLKP